MPNVWVSNGELVDKWTILEVKLNMLKSKSQLEHVLKEKDLLSSEMASLKSKYEIAMLEKDLFSTNLKIWNLMSEIYLISTPSIEYAHKSFEITDLNQKRALIKRDLDLLTHSDTREEKSFFENPMELVEKVQD